MSAQQLEGVVLHRAATVGGSRIVEVLTVQRGRLRLRAPAAAASRRRFGGSLDVFARLQLFVHPQVRGEGLPCLTHVEAIDARLGLRQQLGGLAAAALWCQAVRRLVPEATAVPSIYQALEAALAAAEAGRWAHGSLFVLRLAGELGTPLIVSCSLCQQRRRWPSPAGLGWGWLSAATIACSSCRGGLRPLPAALLRALDGIGPASDGEAVAITDCAVGWLAAHHGLSPRALQVSLWPPPPA